MHKAPFQRIGIVVGSSMCLVHDSPISQRCVKCRVRECISMIQIDNSYKVINIYICEFEISKQGFILFMIVATTHLFIILYHPIYEILFKG